MNRNVQFAYVRWNAVQIHDINVGEIAAEVLL